MTEGDCGYYRTLRRIHKDIPINVTAANNVNKGYSTPHPNGATNFLVGDGSVHTFMETINGYLYQSFGQRASGKTKALP